MSALSDYLENALINLVLRNTAFSALGTVYIALGTADFTDAANAVEPSAASYARATVTAWNAPSNGATSNTNAIVFAQAAQDWGTITHAAVFDAATNGNMLFHGALTNSKIVQTGDTFQFAAGAFQITLA